MFNIPFSPLDSLSKVLALFGVKPKEFWTIAIVSGAVVLLSFAFFQGTIDAKIADSEKQTMKVIEINQMEIIGKIDGLRLETEKASGKLDKTNDNVLDLYKEIGKIRRNR